MDKLKQLIKEEENKKTINYARNFPSGRVAKLLIKIVDEIEKTNE